MTTIYFQPYPARALQIRFHNVFEVNDDQTVFYGVDDSGFVYFFEPVYGVEGDPVVEGAKKAWLEEREYRHARRVRSELDGGVV